MVRPEPFRAMIEQALEAEKPAPAKSKTTPKPSPLTATPLAQSSASSSKPAKITKVTAVPATTAAVAVALEKRLDQLDLPGGATPARGMRVPLRVTPPAAPFEVSAPPADLAAATKKLERPAALDALIHDAVVAGEMTREMPPQSLPARAFAAPPPKLAPMPELAKPAPIALPPTLANPFAPVAKTTPPPLPPKTKTQTASQSASSSSSSNPAHTAPAPRIVQVLDENTIPGMLPLSSSSSGGRAITRTTDFYKLHLEFEDTPARPLPALASLLPMPVVEAAPAMHEPHELGDAMGDVERLQGVESTDLHRLEELEGIEDLDALAQALGLKSVADVSIPSDEGEPVIDLTHDSLPPRQMSAVRKAAVLKALSDDEGALSSPQRPKLAAKAVTPVIVKIPSRPKVSPQARAQARNLYLTAIEELGKGDSVGAVGHLKLAIHYDESVELYRDLLKTIERTTTSGEAARTDEDEPALKVVRRSGTEKSAREMREMVRRSSSSR